MQIAPFHYPTSQASLHIYSRLDNTSPSSFSRSFRTFAFDLSCKELGICKVLEGSLESVTKKASLQCVTNDHPRNLLLCRIVSWDNLIDSIDVPSTSTADFLLNRNSTIILSATTSKTHVHFDISQRICSRL